MKVGTKLRSATGTTEVVITRAPAGEIVLECAGQPLAEDGSGSEASSGADSDILLGKRYVDEESGVELLCSKPGPGPLTADGRELQIKGAKPLPASD